MEQPLVQRAQLGINMATPFFPITTSWAKNQFT